MTRRRCWLSLGGVGQFKRVLIGHYKIVGSRDQSKSNRTMRCWESLLVTWMDSEVSHWERHLSLNRNNVNIVDYDFFFCFTQSNIQRAAGSFYRSHNQQMWSFFYKQNQYSLFYCSSDLHRIFRWEDVRHVDIIDLKQYWIKNGSLPESLFYMKWKRIFNSRLHFNLSASGLESQSDCAIVKGQLVEKDSHLFCISNTNKIRREQWRELIGLLTRVRFIKICASPIRK